METLVIRSDNREKLEAIKVIAKALKVPFKIEKESYDSEFVAKIRESRKQFEEGKYKEIEIDDLWK